MQAYDLPRLGRNPKNRHISLHCGWPRVRIDMPAIGHLLRYHEDDRFCMDVLQQISLLGNIHTAPLPSAVHFLHRNVARAMHTHPVKPAKIRIAPELRRAGRACIIRVIAHHLAVPIDVNLFPRRRVADSNRLSCERGCSSE
jgi:hypothetical protein